MSVMRVAIAGTCGLARLIARYIQDNTSHNVILLSRNVQPQLTSEEFQVAVVDYSDSGSLQFALLGIDTVISTVTGSSQIDLIKAAVFAKVRRFAPAEFEGPPQLSSTSDPLARNRTIARHWLQYFSNEIQSTIFVCGIFYERFLPGGLMAAGLTNAGVNREGDYIVDCRAMTAQAPLCDENNSPNVIICLTAMHDVAQFVTKALEIQSWPPELRMCSERIEVRSLVSLVTVLRGHEMETTVHSVATLRNELQVAVTQQDIRRCFRLQALLNTAEGRYNYTDFNLNRAFADVRVTPFREWFAARLHSFSGI